MTDADIAELVAWADKSGDGQVDFKEFSEALASASNLVPPPVKMPVPVQRLVLRAEDKVAGAAAQAVAFANETAFQVDSTVSDGKHSSASGTASMPLVASQTWRFGAAEFGGKDVPGGDLTVLGELCAACDTCDKCYHFSGQPFSRLCATHTSEAPLLSYTILVDIKFDSLTTTQRRGIHVGACGPYRAHTPLAVIDDAGVFWAVSKKHTRTQSHVDLLDATANNRIVVGQWHRLAITVEISSSQVCTYVDGHAASSCVNPRRIFDKSEFALRSPWMVLSGDAPCQGAWVKNVQVIHQSLVPEDIMALGRFDEPLF
jgi:hypothetical protein